MASGKIKYYLFLFLFVSILGAELILNKDNPIVPLGKGKAESLVTGNIVSDNADLPSPGTLVMVVIIAFIIVAGFFLFKQKELKLRFIEQKRHSYASLVLRLVLGTFLVIAGFDVIPSWQGYALGIGLMVAGIMLMVGIFVRPVSYVTFFYFLVSIIQGNGELAVNFILLAMSLAVFFIGGSEFSLDEEKKVRKQR
jgi:uncharacterized membrane protein YphA (DoxX/SURF4 family)